MAAVKQAYWTLKATRANVDVQQRSLDLARELARENKVRVDAGHIPPIDLVQAEAEVAQRRENLIRAHTAADDAEDALRRLIVNADDREFWKVRLEPVEDLSVIAALPDIDAAVANALDQRYDIARAGRELENTQTTIDFLDNQRLPDVRLETSYRGNGLAGTQFLRGGGFPGSIIGTRNRGFGDALGQVFSDDYPTWSLGVTVSYPIGRSFEEANLARARVERRQTTQRIASLRIEAAETVRRAGRQVRSTAERVEAARAGASLAQERLDSEQKRFGVGLSTTFLVTQAQRDLLEAQVNLLQTSLDFESALVNFEAVQQAPPLAAGATLASGARAWSWCPRRRRAASSVPARGSDAMARAIAVVGAPSSIGIRPYDDGMVRHLNRAPSGAARTRSDRAPGRRGSGRRRAAVVSGLRAAAERAAQSRTRSLAYSRFARGARARRHRAWPVRLVIGGDCSVVLACLLAARKKAGDAVGLVYVDAHADFASPEESRTGSAASMALALATGRSQSPLVAAGRQRAAGRRITASRCSDAATRRRTGTVTRRSRSRRSSMCRARNCSPTTGWRSRRRRWIRWRRRTFADSGFRWTPTCSIRSRWPPSTHLSPAG